MPPNGARIVLRAIVALISPIFACRLLELGVRLVPVRLGHDSGLAQSGDAVDGQLGELALRLGRRELRGFLPRVELDEQVALAHRPAGFERDLLDDARKVRGHDDAVHGGHAADRGQRRGPILLLRHHGRDRFRRHLEIGLLRHALLDLPVLHGSDRGEEHRNHEEHQDHSLLHMQLTSTYHLPGLGIEPRPPARLPAPITHVSTGIPGPESAGSLPNKPLLPLEIPWKSEKRGPRRSPRGQ